MTVYYKGESIFQVPNPTAATYRLTYRQKQRYATKPKGKEPAPYRYALYKTLDWPPAPHMDAPTASLCYGLNAPSNVTALACSSKQTQADDKALSKAKDAIYGEASQLAASWGERKQTVDMIADRANQMRRAWTALRRGDLNRFKRELHLPIFRGDNRWSRPTDAAKIWLEYHFGWSPLIGDIGNAIDVLQRPGPVLDVKARATVREHNVLYQPQGGTWKWWYNWPEVTFRTLLGGKVRVDNPNLYRATQLGLVNPASVAWELIPFSFLVDWFIPVGEFLDSWTAWCGVSLEQTFTTRSRKGRGSQHVQRFSPWTVEQPQTNTAYVMARTLGWPTKSWPSPKAFKGFSVTRGATAISLLVAVLKPGRDLPQPRNRS